MPFAVAFVLGAGLTPALAWVGLRMGLEDRPSEDGLKIHANPVPLTGGIGVVIAALLGLVATGNPLDPWFATAVVLLLAVGVADDAVTLPPIVRLVAQFALGVVIAVGGATFSPLGDLGPALVVLAVPVMANAVNLMDGQDGLAAGSTGVAVVGMTVIATTQGATAPQGLSLTGALIAFLIWNRPPASVFLGDGGAYAIGGILVLLAADAPGGSEVLLGSLICLGLFAFELGSTVVRRVANRSSALSGDRDHIYDLLAGRLGGRTRSTLVLLAAGAFLDVCGWAVSRSSLAAGVLVAAILTAIGSFAILTLWRGSAASLRRSG